MKALNVTLARSHSEAILAKYNLKAHDLAATSTQRLTHKMVSRACKGRRLTLNIQNKALNAMNLAVD
jgi:hypothetical protein